MQHRHVHHRQEQQANKQQSPQPDVDNFHEFQHRQHLKVQFGGAHSPNSPCFGSSTNLSDSSPPAMLPYVKSLMLCDWQYCSMPFNGRLSSKENWTCTHAHTKEAEQRGASVISTAAAAQNAAGQLCVR